MHHAHVIEGCAFRLRPIADADAAFVAQLRTHPDRSRWLQRSAPGTEAQWRWLAAYYARPGDFQFIVEPLHGGPAEGTIALHGVPAEAAGGRAEWGRWVLRPGSLAAVESAWLIYRFGFQTLGLHTLRCRTVAANAAVVSFHDACGVTGRRVLPAAVQLQGVAHDAVEHHTDVADWAELGMKLAYLSRCAARLVRRKVEGVAV